MCHILRLFGYNFEKTEKIGEFEKHKKALRSVKIQDTYCFYMLKKKCRYGTLLKHGGSKNVVKREGKRMTYISCYRLKGDKCLLADERNKKHLLDEILKMHGEKNWPVYVFCVTDEDAYVIMESGGDTTLQEEVEHTIVRFLGCYEGYLQADTGNRFYLSDVWQIDRNTELLEACKRLHCLPVCLGYVGRPGDYWWSSYRAYLGGFAWQMLECGVVLRQLSEVPEKARGKFRMLHKKR